MKKRLVVSMFALALLSALIFAFAAVAQAQNISPQTIQQNPAMNPLGAQPATMSSQQMAILAETWTLTPQRSARAGFTGLPLRNCEGLYCGELAKMPIGTQVDILVNDREGWALVHVPSINMYGWVNTQNIF